MIKNYCAQNLYLLTSITYAAVSKWYRFLFLDFEKLVCAAIYDGAFKCLEIDKIGTFWTYVLRLWYQFIVMNFKTILPKVLMS